VAKTKQSQTAWMKTAD